MQELSEFFVTPHPLDWPAAVKAQAGLYDAENHDSLRLLCIALHRRAECSQVGIAAQEDISVMDKEQQGYGAR